MNRCRTASGIRKPPDGITDDRDERCIRAGNEARRMAKVRTATTRDDDGVETLGGKTQALLPVDTSSIGN